MFGLRCVRARVIKNPKKPKKAKTNAAESTRQSRVAQKNILQCTVMSEGYCEVGLGKWETSGTLGSGVA